MIIKLLLSAILVYYLFRFLDMIFGRIGKKKQDHQAWQQNKRPEASKEEYVDYEEIE